MFLPAAQSWLTVAVSVRSCRACSEPKSEQQPCNWNIADSSSAQWAEWSSTQQLLLSESPLICCSTWKEVVDSMHHIEGTLIQCCSHLQMHFSNLEQLCFAQVAEHKMLTASSTAELMQVQSKTSQMHVQTLVIWKWVHLQDSLEKFSVLDSHFHFHMWQICCHTWEMPSDNWWQLKKPCPFFVWQTSSFIQTQPQTQANRN